VVKCKGCFGGKFSGHEDFFCCSKTTAVRKFSWMFSLQFAREKTKKKKRGWHRRIKPFFARFEEHAQKKKKKKTQQNTNININVMKGASFKSK
jgi:hypothetical protein